MTLMTSACFWDRQPVVHSYFYPGNVGNDRFFEIGTTARNDLDLDLCPVAATPLLVVIVQYAVPTLAVIAETMAHSTSMHSSHAWVLLC
jgi:hypothetical protein